MFKTLRRKFIAVAMLSITLVLAVIIGGINVFNYISINQSADQLMNLLENGGGEHKPPEKPSDAPKKDRDILSRLAGRHALPAEAAYKTRYFTVTLNENGDVCAIDTGKIHAINSDQAEAYARDLFAGQKTDGFIRHYKYRRIEQNNDNVRRYLYIFLDCEEDFLKFEDFLFSSLLFSVIGLLIVFVLVMFFSKKILKPVAESYAKQKRFITDASHEIKTPLTIIDADTEILEMTGEENEWTKSIRNQVKRLADLTEKLVFLSRMDEGNSPVNMVDFSLTDVIKEVTAPFLPIAQTRNIELSLNLSPGATVHGDEHGIRQMISLLTDNALKYASSPGEIRITLKAAGRSLRLSVWNSVDEIEPGNHDELFDRFYRRDASRNSKTGGHGIGLSVVQAIVLAHRGKISCRSHDSHSIEFTITL